MTFRLLFHYLLFFGSLAMPLGLLLLTAVQFMIGRRLGSERLNFIAVLKLPSRDLNRRELFLRQTGALLLLSGLALCVFTGSVLAIIG